MKIKCGAKSINVTFPTSSYHCGNVKVNGETIGIWGENFQGYWHSRFEYMGEKRHIWTCRRTDVCKADIVNLVVKEIVSLINNEK